MGQINPPIQLVNKISGWTSQLTTVSQNTEISTEDKRDLMQTIVQSAVDAVTRSFSEVGDSVVAEASAGGRRGDRGQEALPYLRRAMRCVERWTAMSKNASPGEIMTELLETLPPLQSAYDCIHGASGKLA